MCIIHSHLFDEISTGLNDSLNQRLKLLAGTDDDLPVNYIQDLGLEGGQVCYDGVY
jgi:hypothetical protein